MLKKAFSLIELSIAILVISILVVGFLNVSSGKNNNNNVKITKDRINIVYKSLGEFVLKNKRLPCPASIKSIKNTDANYGIEGTAAGTCTSGTGVYLSTVSGATNMVYGMIPVKSLGLSNDYGEDGFGSKFAYIVDKTYTTGTTFSTSSGNILIKKYINGAYVSDSNNAIFAIISYGPNKSSSFNVNSSSQNTITSDTDEMFNDPITLNDAAKTADFSQTLVNFSERGTIFDDIVFYKSRDQFLKDSKALNIVDGNITSSASRFSGCTYSVTGGSPSIGTVLSGSGTISCDTANHYSSNGYPYNCSGSTAITGTCECAAGYTGTGCSTQVSPCTGGDITKVSGSTIHTFTTTTSDKTLNCTDKGARTVQLLVVAGGGSGGGHPDTEDIGGGGGGGVFYASAVYLTANSYSVTVGVGATGVSAFAGNNGGDSSFKQSTTTLVVVKGGGGGGGNAAVSKSGGSGGGGHGGNNGGASSSGTSTIGGSFYGNSGGSSNGSAGGGGGGASSSGGGASNNNGGNGGGGFTSSISGSSQVYGSGGGGNGTGTGTKGAGGTNAGNAGTNKNATSNFGGGGGAAARGYDSSGSGGSGVVIIRY